MSASQTLPSAELILRVQLADALGADDLETLSKEAEAAGSLEAAVVRVLKRGLSAISPTRPAKKGARK
ncbi:MAG TPA: hypothetical protein VD994_19735 [Prosthecobacter sp.]|nr:hypothetical protein [Prosthecobacter sp.]